MTKKTKTPTKISELIPDDKNFNKGSEFGGSLISKSLQKFGAGRSILLDKNNRIIAGNKTVENAGAVGLEDIEVIETDGKRLIAVKRTDIDLDTPEGRELALADNASAKANIVFDAELVAAEVGEAVCEEWGIETSTELEAEEDDFDVPEGGIETDIVLGDLFEIGEHRLFCGDSTNPDSVAKLMNGEKADIMVTDPPYNVAYEGKTKDAMTIQNDKMSSSDFKSFLDSFFSCSLIELKEGAPVYVFCPIEDGAFLNAFLSSGLKLQSILIWLKNTIVMGRKDYNYKHEPILYGWKEGAAHKWYGNFDKSTIIECNKPPRNGEHPTMKPIELLETVLKNSSQSNDLVLDLFLGSGSTMVAAHQLKRKCYGMELDPKYCQVIVDRMRKLDPTLVIKRNGKPYEAK